MRASLVMATVARGRDVDELPSHVADELALGVDRRNLAIVHRDGRRHPLVLRRRKDAPESVARLKADKHARVEHQQLVADDRDGRDVGNGHERPSSSAAAR